MAHCPPRSILVAVDFGGASAHAVELAGRLATAFGAGLQAVHAETLEVPPYFTRDQMATIEKERQQARHHAAEELRRFVRTRTDTPVVVRVVEGPPADVLLDEAEGVDLVVVGTHGRRGPRRWWLGSVAERVVHDAPVPVLVVHSSVPGQGSPNRPPESLVVLEPASGATNVRAWAAALGTALSATVQEVPFAAQCRPADLASASLVVVGVPERPAHRDLHDAAVALARTCTLPTLFVPVEKLETPAMREDTGTTAASRVW